MLGLRADPWNPSLPWRRAIIRAVDHLEATATPAPTCGWSYPPEDGEMNSEVISALAMVGTLPLMDDCVTADVSTGSGELPEVLPRDLAPRPGPKIYFGFCCASPVIGTKRTGTTFFFSMPFGVLVSTSRSWKKAPTGITMRPPTLS